MKKGQAAMEFLMTYGWAILVVLAAIGALAYFGVLSPGKLVPDKCTIGPGLDIKDCKVDMSSFTVGIYNGLGVDLSPVQVTVTPTGGSDVRCDTTSGGDGSFTYTIGSLANGGTNTTVVCSVENSKGGTLAVGQRFDADITVVYLKSGESLNHTITGKIQRKVEQ